MLDIVACESNYDPQAKNPNSSASGLFQIIDGTWDLFDCRGDVFNPHDNIDCGVKIALDTFEHWECF